jgi:hypothetical protein
MTLLAWLLMAGWLSFPVRTLEDVTIPKPIRVLDEYPAPPKPIREQEELSPPKPRVREDMTPPKP